MPALAAPLIAAAGRLLPMLGRAAMVKGLSGIGERQGSQIMGSAPQPSQGPQAGPKPQNIFGNGGL